MDAEVIQFPTRPSRALAATETSEEIFTNAARAVCHQTVADAAEYLLAKDPEGFEQASEDERTATIAYTAVVMLQIAATMVCEAAEQKGAAERETQDS